MIMSGNMRGYVYMLELLMGLAKQVLRGIHTPALAMAIC